MGAASADGNARKAVLADVDFDARQNLDGLAKSPSHEAPLFLVCKDGFTSCPDRRSSLYKESCVDNLQ